MQTEFTEEHMRKVMEEARAMRSKEVARLFGLLFRRRRTQTVSVAVNG